MQRVHLSFAGTLLALLLTGCGVEILGVPIGAPTQQGSSFSERIDFPASSPTGSVVVSPTSAPASPVAAVSPTSSPAQASYTLKEFPVPRGSGPHDVAPAQDGGVWFTAQRSGHL